MATPSKQLGFSIAFCEMIKKNKLLTPLFWEHFYLTAFISRLPKTFSQRCIFKQLDTGTRGARKGAARELQDLLY